MQYVDFAVILDKTALNSHDPAIEHGAENFNSFCRILPVRFILNYFDTQLQKQSGDVRYYCSAIYRRINFLLFKGRVEL